MSGTARGFIMHSNRMSVSVLENEYSLHSGMRISHSLATYGAICSMLQAQRTACVPDNYLLKALRISPHDCKRFTIVTKCPSGCGYTVWAWSEHGPFRNVRSGAIWRAENSLCAV